MSCLHHTRTSIWQDVLVICLNILPTSHTYCHMVGCFSNVSCLHHARTVIWQDVLVICLTLHTHFHIVGCFSNMSCLQSQSQYSICLFYTEKDQEITNIVTLFFSIFPPPVRLQGDWFSLMKDRRPKNGKNIVTLFVIYCNNYYNKGFITTRFATMR